MQAARRLVYGRVRSAVKAMSFRLQVPRTFSQLQRVLNEGVYTGNMNNKMAWQKIGTIAAYSSSSSYVTDAVIEVINPQPQERMLKVRWKGGDEDAYPYIWLRDNCQCSACFHPVSLARRVMLKDLCLSINGTEFKVRNDGSQLEVQWSDGHQGMYSAQWLKDRAFRGTQHDSKDQRYKLEEQYWGHELQDHLPRASFSDILDHDGALLNFLEDLETLGVVLVSGVPTEQDQLHRLVHRVGYLKPCHYGETFLVQNRLDPNNLAYTGDTLDMHTDLPCMASKPQIQMLHCIKQFNGEGGDNVLVDGFAAVTKLRENNPNHFDMLAQVLIDFVDVGTDEGNKFHVAWRAPTIDQYPDGSLRTVNWHQMSRASRFKVPLDVAEQWYEALLALRDITQDPENIVTLKLEAGDMIIFDNLRILHGRTGYRVDYGERVLQGGYLEWDSVRSLRRVLRQEMAA